MIRRIVGWFVLVPLCAVLVVFALANRHSVSLRFDPISPETPFVPPLEIPLFAVIYGMLFLGIVLGGVAAWFAQGRNRQAKRRLKRENDKLTKEIIAARQAARQKPRDQALLAPDDILEDV